MAAEAVKEKNEAPADELASGAATPDGQLPEGEGEAPPRRRRFSKKTLLIALLVASVAIGQGVITYLLLPAVTGESSAHEPDEKEAPLTDAKEGEHTDAHDADAVEVAVGEFVCSNGSAAPGSIVHVDCKVSAITAGNQVSALEHQLKAHQARARQAINKIIRSSNLEELNDPNLGTMKRLIREELNRLFRKSLIVEIVVTDIRVIEQ